MVKMTNSAGLDGAMPTTDDRRISQRGFRQKNQDRVGHWQCASKELNRKSRIEAYESLQRNRCRCIGMYTMIVYPKSGFGSISWERPNRFLYHLSATFEQALVQG
jgi:hypothetical protein